MRRATVISEHDLDGQRPEGDTALEKVTIDAGLLEQRVLRFAPGRSGERGEVDRDELLYVVSGGATLELDGEPHQLARETGAYIRAGERYTVENPGPEELLLVSVAAPAGEDLEGRRVTIRFAEQPELRADAKRTFRYLVNEDAGCAEVTQFVGVVEPCRAPDHSHTYDEVGYIVEGQGIAHIDGEQIPLRPGSCFHLPPEQVHCIENSGPGAMRILGVFHPSGDPASRSYDAAAAGATS
ncbi:MAG: cupin domain-containing protein [Gaiellaceae bacterium MAG52_C11]|nr:cupin domain-containing protein [Candidatus Gaiellasilicea maunaloa]